MPIRPSVEYYRERVRSMTNLPTIPVIATEILRITREDKLSISQMLPIIKKDPPLAAKILKIANSAYFGLQTEISSLRQAIVVIGLRELGYLVLSFSVLKAFIEEGSRYHLFEWNKLWEHSSACGHVAELLGKQLQMEVSGSLYSLGLLHDIGKLVLFRLDSEKYVQSVRLVKKEGIRSYQAEEKVFGVSHGEVGMWLAERWELPEAIVNTIGYHHHPEQLSHTNYRMATALIQVADLVCHLKSMSFESDHFYTVPREEKGWQVIQTQNENMARLDFERFVMSMDDEISTIRKMVELTIV